MDVTDLANVDISECLHCRKEFTQLVDVLYSSNDIDVALGVGRFKFDKPTIYEYVISLSCNAVCKIRCRSELCLITTWSC